MRNKLSRFVATALIFAVALTTIFMPVNAAKKVHLNKTSVTLNVGKTVTLKLVGSKKKAKWKTSNKKVATVNKTGKVTAKKVGSATITAKVGLKKYKSKVQVVENNIATTKNISTTEAKKQKVLVAYFSRADENYGVGTVKKGNTEIIAEMIAAETGADLFKIERKNAYPADYKKCTAEAQEEQKKNARPELKNQIANFDDYDVVYLGMPVWWGDMPMPVYTFVENLNWSGKTVYPFTTHAGSGLSGIPSIIKSECKGAKVESGFTIEGTTAQKNQTKAKEEVLKWIGK